MALAQGIILIGRGCHEQTCLSVLVFYMQNIMGNNEFSRLGEAEHTQQKMVTMGLLCLTHPTLLLWSSL